MKIAAEICIYTNDRIITEEIEIDGETIKEKKKGKNKERE
jgi:hypothetical protein